MLLYSSAHHILAASPEHDRPLVALMDFMQVLLFKDYVNLQIDFGLLILLNEHKITALFPI